MVHYHVQRHAEDDNAFVSEGIGAAMDYCATALGEAADLEYTLINIHGEAGRFEDAYHAWVLCEAWGNAQQNAENIAKQYSATDENDRAPLYQGPGWEARLAEAATHTMAEVNRNGPVGFLFWVCALASECPGFAAFGED